MGICFLFLVTTPAGRCVGTEQSISGYRVQLHLAVSAMTMPSGKLARDLSEKIHQRLQATIYPLWQTHIVLVQGPQKHQLQRSLRDFSLPPPPAENEAECDKQFYLGVRETATGYRLACREYDVTIGRWGPVQEQTVVQRRLLIAQCLDLLRATFAPLAIVRPHPAEKNQVLLHFRGSGLPSQHEENLFYHLGDVYQAVLVRSGPQGAVQGIRQVPWTFITLEQNLPTGGVGQVHSGIRTPLGMRRRGRVEHVAIGLRSHPGTTKIRFHARHDVNQGLSGYEVYVRDSTDRASRLLGSTDTQGTISIAPSKQPVQTLFLRSEGQLLAKVPVVAEAGAEIAVPVADDLARLRAQSVLTALQEQLTDLVARRQILIARIRQALETGQLETADALLDSLDDLPGRAQFDQLLSSAENNRRHRSSDPQVQARMEQLFAATRKLLGRFLGLREVSQLRKELDAARSATEAGE